MPKAKKPERRKIPPKSKITETDIALVRAALDAVPRLRSYQLKTKGKRILIEEPLDSGLDAPSLMMLILGAEEGQDLDLRALRPPKKVRYETKFRLELDPLTGKYVIERRCYRGDLDWLLLEAGSLPALLKRYIKHLGRESFYELI